MEKLSFEIYTPDDKQFRLTPNWIVFISWGLMSLAGWLFDSYIKDNPFFLFSAVSVGLISLYYIVSSFFTHAALNGTINGIIEFDGDQIIVNQATFTLKEITAIDFFFEDYYDKLSSGRRDFNPKLSQGVNNYVNIDDSNGEGYSIYMKMCTEHHYLALAPFISQAVALKKISFNRAVELVGIENVSL